MYRSGPGSPLNETSVLKRTFLPISAFANKVVTLDAMDTNPGLFNDDISSAIGTETLLVDDMVPDGLSGL
jgi:hypothetical protein